VELSDLDSLAKRQDSEEKAAKALAGARAGLVLGRDASTVFFASLALRLVPEVDWNEKTMATDGKGLFYNPDFVNGLNKDELRGVVVHEVMHPAMGHHARRQGRDLKRWNTATDLSINPLIKAAGLQLPAGMYMPGEGEFADLPKDKSAEEYYNLLPQGNGDDEQGGQQPRQGGGGQGDGQGDGEQSEGGGKGTPDPGGCGAVKDPPQQTSNSQAESEWKEAVAQAENASKGKGNLPGGLARMVDKVVRPVADWRDVLREFVSQQARNDYSWARPNRRFIHLGLYLPGMHSEELGDVVVMVDTSGSIGQRELALFGNELNGILGAFDCSVTVLYHDTTVCHVQHWRSTDGPLELEAKGGGGTSHVDAFDWIRREGASPACVVALTDMDTTFPADPGVPTLWAAVSAGTKSGPFGRTIHLDQ
jgi:predicted metal-dependent peptidase